MRNFGKVILTFVFLAAAVAFVPVTSEAAAVPTGVKETDADRTAVEVTWDAVPNADAYFVQMSSDGVNWEQKLYDAISPRIVLRSLNPGSSYYVRVASYDMNGTTNFTEDDVLSEFSAPVEVVTSPDAANITIFNCTNATTDSLSFEWNACPGATSYNVYDYSNNQLLATTAEPKFTRTGLASGVGYGIKVLPVRTAATTGFSAYTNSYYMSGIKTVPGAPKTSDFSVNAGGTTATSVNYMTKRSASADGYEIEVCKVKGGARVQTLTATNGVSTNSMKINRNLPYKYRMRYYVSVGDKKFYSEWSGYRYFFLQNISGKINRNAKKITLKWGKVTGATGYTVYISTKANGKYKKVKSFGKNSKGATITKIKGKKLRSNQSYYIKLVAKVKDGSKTIKNDAQIINTAKR